VLACLRTFFDSDEADQVLAEERGRRRERLAVAAKPLELEALAPPIREQVAAARRREQQIRDAIDRAELPYEEVTSEVDGFVRAMEKTASRAQLLFEALRDTPPEAVERRLQTVRAERDPARQELVDALEHQLHVQQRMQTQLGRFYDEMERMVIELDTIRGSLLSASVSEGSSAQRELAGEVRGLRERMGAVSDGLAEAFEET
jgi:predicted  nucleic acid-binding Zn-ribbon protein